MKTRHRIWTNVALPPEAAQLLHDLEPKYELTWAKRHSPQPEGCSIAFGHPDPAFLMESPCSLRWLHVASAGYTPYDRDDFREFVKNKGILVTNSSTVYEEPCAQHALAMILAMSRRIPEAFQNQREERGWPGRELRDASPLLNGKSFLIVGFGRIGWRLTELLQPFQPRITGIRRHPRGDEGVPVHAQSEIDRLLPAAEHVVNILPEAPGTGHFFDKERFGRFQPGAFFYNIGRGTTVDQQALESALRSGRLGAAYLDVTDPEPLPADHSLWTTPNCYITPHTAGGHVGELGYLVRHFLNNLERFEKGEPLKDLVMG